MGRRRLGARANALTFPLPWEDLLNQLREHDADLEFPGEVELSLPRLPEELAEVVRVILKANKQGDTTEAEVNSLIHQANIRRSVIVNLILDMKAFGHQSYQYVREEEVRERAAVLPEDGVPPQVLRIINHVDDSAEKLQPQKAATPCDGMQRMECAGEIFAKQRARAVVAEGHSVDRQDTTGVAIAALDDLCRGSAGESKQAGTLQTLEVRTGNQLVDQFRSTYFALAFTFCFKFGTACPDVVNTTAKMKERTDRDQTRKDLHHDPAPKANSSLKDMGPQKPPLFLVQVGKNLLSQGISLRPSQETVAKIKFVQIFYCSSAFRSENPTKLVPT